MVFPSLGSPPPVDVARRRRWRARFFPSLNPDRQKLTRVSLSLARCFFYLSHATEPPSQQRKQQKNQNETKTEIGVGLTAFGVLFTFLGVAFFFDRGLLAMGNVLFLSGVALTIGPRATLRFFTRRKNMRVSRRGFSLFLVKKEKEK